MGVAGVVGSSNQVGVWGEAKSSLNSYGVVALGASVGLSATATGANGIAGVFQGVTAVAAYADTVNGVAVQGVNRATTGEAHAIAGLANSSQGIALVGQNLANAGAGEAIGVLGHSGNHPAGRGGFFIGNAIGVKGQPNAAGGVGVEAGDGGISGAEALWVDGGARFMNGSTSFTAHVDFSSAVVTGLSGGGERAAEPDPQRRQHHPRRQRRHGPGRAGRPAGHQQLRRAGPGLGGEQHRRLRRAERRIGHHHRRLGQRRQPQRLGRSGG
jgi:hypothetical protein